MSNFRPYSITNVMKLRVSTIIILKQIEIKANLYLTLGVGLVALFYSLGTSVHCGSSCNTRADVASITNAANTYKYMLAYMNVTCGR